jgi:hypothetical protein
MGPLLWILSDLIISGLGSLHDLAAQVARDVTLARDYFVDT